MNSHDILSPTRSEHHDEYAKDCQAALRPALQDLVSQAEKAGWNREVVSEALLELSGALFRRSVADLLAADHQGGRTRKH